MTKQQCFDSLQLIRNQLDKLPLDEYASEGNDLENAYTIVYATWQYLEEMN